jgi:hypothetical protein
MDKNPGDQCFFHEGWDVRIDVQWNELERRFTGSAELFLNRAIRCRIALEEGLNSQDEAVASLRLRSTEYISDWARRDHSADSEFSEL